MTGECLVALLHDVEMGRLYRDRQNRLTFVYADAWRTRARAIALSVSMPLSSPRHAGDVVESFIWGLLPDNERTLQRWGQRFQVSSRNAFGLLRHVGADCAGAVQFLPVENVDGLRASSVEWLEEGDIAERLRILRTDQAAWRLQRDSGQFSLAGTQPKTALLYQRGRWGVPSGRIPTTHILKPPIADFDGHVENEHFCLTLARAMGLPAASSQIVRFREEVAIVVERYDRVWDEDGGAFIRVHQEDLCQALGRPPSLKYQNEGGPGVDAIAGVLRANSTAPVTDVLSFIDALAFNWLIGGTDGHAKNYSLLHAAGGVRLAPLYDLSSALPYDHLDFMRLTLAMKIGGKDRLRDVGSRQWLKLTTTLNLEPEATRIRILDLARRMVDNIENVRHHLLRGGLTHPVIERLAQSLERRARACASALAEHFPLCEKSIPSASKHGGML